MTVIRLANRLICLHYSIWDKQEYGSHDGRSQDITINVYLVHIFFCHKVKSKQMDDV